MKTRHAILCIAIAAGSALSAISAFAALPATLDRSPVLTKQTASAYSLCQAELRRRMGGARSMVSISIHESTPAATTIRLTGQGTYRRDENSRFQPFNFACVVNLEQDRVASLSYSFTSN